MNTKWFGNLKGEEKENFKKSLLQSKKVLDKLQEICYNMYIDKRRVEFSDYESPSWAYRQAHTNGYSEAMNDVFKLLDIKTNIQD